MLKYNAWSKTPGPLHSATYWNSNYSSTSHERSMIRWLYLLTYTAYL